jgi:hypothetical protein
MGSRDQLRLAVGAAHNRNLFPVHFLEERLQDWPEYASLDCSELLEMITDLWERERDLLPGFNEEQTEDRLIRPVLLALGFQYTTRPDHSVGGRRREPDYALFLDEETRRSTERLGGAARYANAIAIVEAKRFDRSLDRRRATGSLSEDPVAQIIHYVSTTRVPFGILTNGRIWRLYAQKGDLVEGAHYEVDLIALMEAGDPRALRRFAAFFRAAAFRPDASGRSFLDRALDESRANAVKVGDALQRQVFRAVPDIALGLLGEDGHTPESLKKAFEHGLVFLYRLLFCLHAEARGLLPVDSRHYFEYSIRKQRQEVAAAVDDGQKFGHASARLYNDLEALFTLVNAGDEALGVNEYNGGLFSPGAHAWLRGRVVPDELLAPALDGLYRLDGQMIDYRDLSVRHLGTVYERLLDFQLVPEDGRLKLEPAQGRKETGSYFTPEPIVDLIVERTLEPLLDRRSAEVAAQGLTGERALEAFLGLRVLDPAMGSGHFLVSAAAYIAQFIATDPSYDGSLDWREIQRLVAERCLYGVDLNPMAVELARLSLWLSTVMGDEPLTFLSNLRTGDSLVGADVDDLLASEVTLFAERLARDAEALLARTAEVAEKRSVSGEAVHQKERAAEAADALRQPLDDFADEAIAPHFSQPQSMFHWELEFPEVFLATDGSLRSNGGFDAVIGNPPYIRIQTLDRELAKWCRARYQTAFGSFDAYLVFIERAFGLLRSGGRLGFIVPNKFLKLESAKKLRSCLAEGRLVEEIIDFADAQLFEGATNYTCILILDASAHDELRYRKVAGEVSGVPTAREIEAAVPESFGAAELGDAPWTLVGTDERRILEVIARGALRLEELTDGIFTGLQTSADSVYILEDRGQRPGGRLVYSKASGRELVLEPDLLHPLASGTDVERYAFKPLGNLLLFPYRRGSSGMELLSEADLGSLPKTAAYLGENEGALREREGGKMDSGQWYAFGRTQSLGLHDLPKLGVAATVSRLEIAADPGGDVYFHNVRVNGILSGPNGPPLWCLLTLLNSQLIDWVFKRGAAEHANGHFAANKQFIASLPIKRPDAAGERQLGALGRSLHDSVKALLEERSRFLAWLSDLIGAPVASLAGRTKLEFADELPLAEVIAILQKNRDRLNVDPGARFFHERLAREHSASVEAVATLNRAIDRDEGEADAAVFELYELSEAQRSLVEGSHISA